MILSISGEGVTVGEGVSEMGQDLESKRCEECGGGAGASTRITLSFLNVKMMIWETVVKC